MKADKGEDCNEEQMSDEDTTSVTHENFFGLSTIRALRDFARNLRDDDPAEAALGFYIGTWEDLAGLAPDTLFSPDRYLARDRSAVMFGDCPVIYEGSNEWCRKPHLAQEHHARKLEGLKNCVAALRRHNPKTPICLVLMPEKDYFISSAFRGETRFRTIEAAFEELGRYLRGLDIELVFNEPLVGMPAYMSLDKLNFPDSHLLGPNYVVFFSRALRALGTAWEDVRPQVTMVPLLQYGDLSEKFEGRRWSPQDLEQPLVASAPPSQIAGSATFENPLGKTWQSFENAAPIVDRSVCILGDSHSSVFHQRRLTYLFASAYRRCDFFWNPCALREEVGRLDYDHVLLEVSSRFVV